MCATVRGTLPLRVETCMGQQCWTLIGERGRVRRDGRAWSDRHRRADAADVERGDGRGSGPPPVALPRAQSGSSMSRRHVLLPTMPSAARPLLAWNHRAASALRGPKFPSTTQDQNGIHASWPTGIRRTARAAPHGAISDFAARVQQARSEEVCPRIPKAFPGTAWLPRQLSGSRSHMRPGRSAASAAVPHAHHLSRRLAGWRKRRRLGYEGEHDERQSCSLVPNTNLLPMGLRYERRM